jgi:hypothetical protein
LKLFDIEETIFGGFSATALAGLPTLVVKFFTKTCTTTSFQICKQKLQQPPHICWHNNVYMEHELSVKPPCGFETLHRGIVEFLNAEVPNTNREETVRRSWATMKSDGMADPTEQTIRCMSMVMMTIPNPNPKPRTQEIQES